jgi:phytoene desaturase
MSDRRLRAAVIGSGFGGLAAAIRLQSSGFDTTIYERRDQPGGRAYVYRDAGFTFDAGPTVITDPACLSELFEAAGRKLEDYVTLAPVTPFYRLLWEDGTRFDYSNDTASLLRQISRLSPADVAGYEAFLKYTAEVYEEGYVKLGHAPFLDWWSMMRVAPQLMRLRAYRSVYSMVSRFIKEPHLRQAFSFHSLLVGGSPFRSSAIYTLIHFLERQGGVHFPMGGTGALVRGMAKLFEELGGKIRLSLPARRLITRGGRVAVVETDRGEDEVDLAVSNADVVHTYRDLLGQEPSARDSARRLAAMDHSMSLFVIYFGTRKKFPGLAHHTVIFGPRYRELLKDIFDRGVLAGDFSLYLHAPTITDPSMAPPGGEAFYVLSPVPHLGKLKIDWAVEGPRYAEKILTYLEARFLPGLKESIVTQRLFTPQDFKTELNAHWGSAFSLEPTLRQSAYFRVHNRDAEIPNLYFVGAGTHPGAGIPGVVGSARATAGLILEDFHDRLAPAARKPSEVAHVA